jgi:hypothetical protein
MNIKFFKYFFKNNLSNNKLLIFLLFMSSTTQLSAQISEKDSVFLRPFSKMTDAEIKSGDSSDVHYLKFFGYIKFEDINFSGVNLRPDEEYLKLINPQSLELLKIEFQSWYFPDGAIPPTSYNFNSKTLETERLAYKFLVYNKSIGVKGNIVSDTLTVIKLANKSPGFSFAGPDGFLGYLASDYKIRLEKAKYVDSIVVAEEQSLRQKEIAEKLVKIDSIFGDQKVKFLPDNKYYLFGFDFINDFDRDRNKENLRNLKNTKSNNRFGLILSTTNNLVEVKKSILERIEGIQSDIQAGDQNNKLIDNIHLLNEIPIDSVIGYPHKINVYSEQNVAFYGNSKIGSVNYKIKEKYLEDYANSDQKSKSKFFDFNFWLDQSKNSLKIVVIEKNLFKIDYDLKFPNSILIQSFLNNNKIYDRGSDFFELNSRISEAKKMFTRIDQNTIQFQSESNIDTRIDEYPYNENKPILFFDKLTSQNKEQVYEQYALELFAYFIERCNCSQEKIADNAEELKIKKTLYLKYGQKYVDAALEGNIIVGMPDDLLDIPLKLWAIDRRSQVAGGYILFCHSLLNTSKRLTIKVLNKKVIYINY